MPTPSSTWMPSEFHSTNPHRTLGGQSIHCACGQADWGGSITLWTQRIWHTARYAGSRHCIVVSGIGQCVSVWRATSGVMRLRQKWSWEVDHGLLEVILTIAGLVSAVVADWTLKQKGTDRKAADGTHHTGCLTSQAIWESAFIYWFGPGCASRQYERFSASPTWGINRRFQLYKNEKKKLKHLWMLIRHTSVVLRISSAAQYFLR